MPACITRLPAHLHRVRWSLLLGALVLWLLSTASPVAAQEIVYVTPAGGGGGAAWDNATDLQDALTKATSGDEIWVATGVYTPGITSADTFQLRPGVALYGGFAGTPGSEGDFSARDWDANPTVLSGDIDGNDSTNASGVVTDTINITGTNAYHVVTGSGVTTTAMLDGFYITAGSATGSFTSPCGAICGGGLYNEGGSPRLANLTFRGNKAERGGAMGNLDTSNPVVTDVHFHDNASAASGGGGMYNVNSSPVISDATFIRNVSGGGGGGMYNVNSTPSLNHVLFEDNFAAAGGGIENTAGSNPLLTAVIFRGNRTAAEGGGLKNLFASATLVNVLFSGNHSGSNGGGLFSNGSDPSLTNVTVSGNTADNEGGGLYNFDSTPILRNTIVSGNDAPTAPNNNDSSVDRQFSLIQGTTTAGVNGNLDGSLDPLFVRPVDCGGDGCTDDPATSGVDESANDDYGDLRLLLTSPAVDAGSDTFVPVGITSDLNANPRRIGSEVDMGAFEAPPPRIYVRQGATGDGTGESWTHAFTTLQAGLQQAVPGVEIWVASGLYTPTLRTDADDPRSATFALLPGVALYGGFAGTPGSENNFAARDLVANLTVLSGDLDGNDGTDANGVVTDTFQLIGDNAYHVVSAVSVTETARLDGFVITAGRANFPIGNRANALGGGMTIGDSSPTLANLLIRGNFALDGGGMIVASGSPSLQQVTFRNNRASTLGGGIFNPGGNPSLHDVAFHENIAEDSGGGMANVDTSAVLTQVLFIANVAEDSGGGMLNRNSSPELTDTTFLSNTAEVNGGGMFNDDGSNPTLTLATFRHNLGEDEGGGMANDNGSDPSLFQVIFAGNFSEDGGGMSNLVSSPTLINVLFAGNRASADGGGLRNLVNANPILTNVTFSGNQAFSGGGIDNIQSSPFLQNTILWHNEATNGPSMNNRSGSTPTVRFSIIEGDLPVDTVDGGNNLDVDPLFVHPVNCGGDGLCADDIATTDTDESADDEYGDLQLQPISPAIDIGDNNVVAVASDLGGLPRIVAVRIVTPTVDLGAYEAPNSPPVFVSSPSLNASEGLAYTYVISSSDPNQPNGSGLSLSALLAPAWLGLVDNADGSGTLSGTPSNADVGDHAVTLQVQDSAGLNATQDFTVTVSATVPDNGGLAGQVTADGTGVPGVTVSVNTPAAANAVSAAAVIAQTVTDDQGKYGFSGLAPGPYTLTFDPPSGFETPKSLEVTVVPGEVKPVPDVILTAKDNGPGDADTQLYLPSLLR